MYGKTQSDPTPKNSQSDTPTARNFWSGACPTWKECPCRSLHRWSRVPLPRVTLPMTTVPDLPGPCFNTARSYSQIQVQLQGRLPITRTGFQAPEPTSKLLNRWSLTMPWYWSLGFRVTAIVLFPAPRTGPPCLVQKPE